MHMTPRDEPIFTVQSQLAIIADLPRSRWSQGRSAYRQGAMLLCTVQCNGSIFITISEITDDIGAW